MVLSKTRRYASASNHNSITSFAIRLLYFFILLCAIIIHHEASATGTTIDNSNNDEKSPTVVSATHCTIGDDGLDCDQQQQSSLSSSTQTKTTTTTTTTTTTATTTVTETSGLLYDSDDLVQFIRKHRLIDNVTEQHFNIQQIQKGGSTGGTTTTDSSIYVNGHDYSLNIDELFEPVNIVSPSATYRFNGVDQSNELFDSWRNHPRTYQRIETITGDTIRVHKNKATTTTDDENNSFIQSIDVTTTSGHHYHFEAIVPNVMIEITSDIVKQSQQTKNRNDLNDYYYSSSPTHNTKNNKIRNHHHHHHHNSNDDDIGTSNRKLLSSSSLLNTKIKKQLLRTSRDTSGSTSSTRELQTTTSCSDYYIIEVAIAYDSTFCESEGGQSNAENAVRAIVENASGLYEGQNVCTKLSLVHIEGYCDTNTDPFTEAVALGDIGCSGGYGVVQWFGDWVTANPPSSGNVEVDTYQLFFYDPTMNVDEGTFGCANQDSMCDDPHGTENLSLGENIIQDDFRSAALLAHEIGHNLGAVHVTDTGDPDYIMEPIGFTEHIWADSTIEILQANLPTFTCISLESSQETTTTTTDAPITTSPTTTSSTTPSPTTGSSTSSPPTSKPTTSPPGSTPSPTPPPTPPSTTLLPTYAPPSFVMEFRLRVANTDLCLNVPGNYNIRLRPQIRIWDCNNRAQQRFQLWSDGSIRSVSEGVNDKCIGLKGPNNNTPTVQNNSPLLLKNCRNVNVNNSISQKWNWASSINVNYEIGKLQSEWNRRKCVSGGGGRGKVARIQNCRGNGQGGQVTWVMENIQT